MRAYSIIAPFSVISSENEEYINDIKTELNKRHFKNIVNINPQIDIQYYESKDMIIMINNVKYKFKFTKSSDAVVFTVKLLDTLDQYPYLIDILRYGDKKQNEKYILNQLSISKILHEKYFLYTQNKQFFIELTNLVPDKYYYSFNANIFENYQPSEIIPIKNIEFLLNALDSITKTQIRVIIYPKMTQIIFSKLIRNSKKIGFNEVLTIKFKFTNDIIKTDVADIVMYIYDKYYNKYQTFIDDYGNYSFGQIDAKYHSELKKIVKYLPLLNNKLIGNISTAKSNFDTYFNLVIVKSKI